MLASFDPKTNPIYGDMVPIAQINVITSLIIALLDIYINVENLGIMFGWKGLVTQQTGTINNDNHKICERNVSLIWLKYSWSALSFLILFSLLPSCLFFFVLLFFSPSFYFCQGPFLSLFRQIVYLISFEVVCVHMLTTSNDFTQSITMVYIMS